MYYDACTGLFFRRFAYPGGKPWERAGYVTSKGYRQLRVDGHAYRENRLAVLYMTGAWPVGQVDHRNRDTADNSFTNLRDVSQSVNKQNCSMYRNNKSGAKGVCWYAPTKKWLAQITRNGKRRHLGYFATVAEASAAFKRACAE